ncbi:MAG: hypothetical protein KAQ88_09880, partial [Hyphomicrobiaceae bacterium]|nr:hypothetical protein [Hyphomicrobiaceae bacterium]
MTTPVFESVTAKLETGAVDTTDVLAVPGGTDQLYLVTTVLYTSNGTPGTDDVTSVTGGGLTFALVPGTVACSGRLSQPRGSVWWAFGSPSSFTCTVNISAVTRAPAGMHVTVSRISGADNAAPVNGEYGNSNGFSSSPTCGGGTDDATARVDLTISNDNSLAFNVGYPRNDDFVAIDADYTQQYFVEHTDGGDASTMLLTTRSDPPIAVDTIQHTIDNDKSWYMIGCEIKEAPAGFISGSIDLTITPAATLGARGELSGSVAMALAPTATIAATGDLAGAVNLAITPAATLGAKGDLAGSANLAFALAATLQGLAAMTGSTALAITPAATLQA